MTADNLNVKEGAKVPKPWNIYEPSPAEIARRAAAIRTKWSEKEHFKRAGLSGAFEQYQILGDCARPRQD